jgi:ATP synthase protein I
MTHDASHRPGRGEGNEWAAMADVVSGVLLWGAIGWLVDAWLDTRIFVGVGLVLGAALGVWLAYLRYGRS